MSGGGRAGVGAGSGSPPLALGMRSHCAKCTVGGLLALSPVSAVTANSSLQPLRSKQSVFFVWELKWAGVPPPPLRGQFSVGFSPASAKQLSISLKPYTYDFQVENFFVCIVLLFWWGCGAE